MANRAERRSELWYLVQMSPIQRLLRPRGRILVAIWQLAVALWLVSESGVAQAPSAAPVSAPNGEREAAVSSPRTTVQRYLELSSQGRFEEAAALLELPSNLISSRTRIARHLRPVLDRRLSLDLEQLSDRPEGALSDGLAANLEQIGTFSDPTGGSQAVRLSLRDGEWRFSRSTVSKVEGWYQDLPDRWLLEHLPSILLLPGPRSLLWWQWLGLSLGVVLLLAIGGLLSRIARHVLSKAALRTASTLDDRLLARMGGPATLAIALGLARAALPWLMLYAPAEDFVQQLLRGIFLVDLLWFFWRLVDVSAEVAWTSEWSHGHPASRALIPLLRRSGKAVVSVAAALLFLSALGYPVTSLLAGLGIGGLAFALASQKTVENLFGAFSLGVDQPFREGDFVRIEDLVGTVESLGLRSTKIRTLDRTLVSIPNGKLAEMRLETFAARDRLRLACTVGVVYSTTAAQMRLVLEGMESVLRQHPKIWPDTVNVRFKELAASSLDIEVMAWFTTSDWQEFLLIRQEMLLAFMRVVEEAGTSFAFPSRSLYVETLPTAVTRP
jgi:MscS family membrane protein